MIEGIIIKGIAGFYYVATSKGIFECKACGKFRNVNISPIVGDRVTVQIIDEIKLTGSVKTILPRKNELIRPKVSNIDQAVIVFSATKPEPNMDILDRFILLIEQQNIDIIICINKIDIDDQNVFQGIKRIYYNAGYKIIASSSKTGQGLDELKKCLKDKISVFAGPSGVGKSSILNELDTKFELKTGELSLKIERGKHTTRHAELMELEQGGYIVDSPGFTSLYNSTIEQEDLQHYFKEFELFIGKCKFKGCSHTHEPGCAVIEQLNKNISPERYERYKIIYNELEEQRRNKYD